MIKRLLLSLIVGLAILILSSVVHLIGLVAFGSIFALYISRHLGFDYLVSIVFSVLCTALISGLLLNLIAITGFGHFFTFLSFVLSIGVAVLIFILSGMKSTKLTYQKISSSSWIALGVTLCIFVFFFLTAVLHRDTSSLISFLSIGEDNISHFTIFNYILQYNMPAIGQTEGIWSGLANYPQGIHSFFAYMFSDINQYFSLTPNQLLTIYYFAECLIASTLSFLILKFLLLQVRIPSLIKYLYVYVTFTLLFVCIVVPFTKLGYFAQMSAATYIVAFLVFTSLTKHLFSSVRIFVVTSISIAGIFTSWYLASILFIPVFIALTSKIIRENLKSYLVLIALLSIAALSGIYHVLYGKSSAAIQEEMGDPFGFSIMFIFAPLILFSVVWLNRKKDNVSDITAYSFLSFTIMLYVFGLYELIVAGAVNYFFYKLALLVTLAGILWISINILSTHKIYQITSSFVVFILLAYALFAQNYFNHLKDFVVFNPNTYFSLQTISETSSQIDNRPIKQTRNLIYVNDCSHFGQYLTNRWLGAIYLTQNDARRIVEINGFRDNIKIKDLKKLKYESKVPLKIFTSSYCEKRNEIF